MKTSKFYCILLSAFAIVTTGSCIDSKYDLNEKSLNKNMSIFNNGISLPVGSVQEITLSQFIDTEGDNIIKEDQSSNGYYLSDKGETDAINLDIDDTNVNNNGSSLEEVFKQENPFIEIFSNSMFTIDAIKLPISNYKDEYDPVIYEIMKESIGEDFDKFELELSEDEEDKVEEKFSVKIDDVPEEITTIYSIEFNEFPIDINLVGKNLTNLTNQLTLNEDFLIEVPDAMVLGNNSHLNIIEENGKRFIDLAGRLITENNTTITVYVKGVKFGTEGLDAEIDPNTGNRVIEYEDSFKFHGGAYITTVYKSEETKKDFIRVPMELRTSAISATAKKVKGKFNIEQSEEFVKIEKSDLPDFLSGNNVVIDATHTAIELVISSEGSKLPTDLPLTARISSVAEDIEREPIETTIMIEADNFSRDENDFYYYRYIISDNGQQKDGYQTITIDGLNNLLYDIPDSIKFNAKVDSNTILDLEIKNNTDINVEFTYSVPLEFGKDLNISYTDTIDGIHGSLGGIKTNGVKLAGKLEYNIPVNMQLSASAVDTEGNTLEGVKIAITPEGKIQNGTHDFSIVITSDDKELIAEKLDAIALKITLTNEDYDENNSEQIKSTDSIYLKDLKISVLGGIEIDADDF